MLPNMIKHLCAAALVGFSLTSQAGIITGGDLLDQSGADFLEARLGLGDLDFTNISDLSQGDSASRWHADVAGYTQVISIYDVLFQGNNYRIGGYSSIGHDGNGYANNAAATADNFLFNLSLGIVHNTQNGPWAGQYDQYDAAHYFATFGGGHDLWGGHTTLGNSGYVHANSNYANGYSYGGSEHLLGSGISGFHYVTIVGLESYVFSTAANVPEPGSLILFGLPLVALLVSRRRRVN